MSRAPRVRRFASPAAFEEAAGAFLGAREAEHNLMLGLLAELRSPQNRYPEWYLSAAFSGPRVLACALRTLPLQVALSHVEAPAALDALVEDLLSADPSLPGVLGERTAARGFAARWRERAGVGATRVLAERIHAATRARPPADVGGALRDAGETDRELLERWLIGFEEEVETAVHPAYREDRVTHWLSQPSRGLVLWEDEGRPVSMAGFMGPTPNGIRIGAVYTPRERRGCGYASACVAALTQRLLDAGRRFCFLYTDLANPVSNRIYARIGYEPVCDVDQYRFG